ncbi:hypothetical protein PAXRUDRAFT_694919 [Paxillus rubicundulus Ve08.2h10]|uniref:Uncharacterized protein n=1 Tax=Paxillus rubicundulus Ve08.2h10 TaxID=930991 RepID=A0A0D0E8A9_9AGAM|nr:hypothetical protein PAXRUDRAFT_694919 [Paxillus rubicundulus Ve08.2h10]
MISEGNKRTLDAIDDDLPRITYHAEQRTFDRLFKEQSLEETKDVVRRKLGLASGCIVKLQQIRGANFIDLEDGKSTKAQREGAEIRWFVADDDFDAFRALVRYSTTVDVQVTVEDSPGSLAGPSQVSEKPSPKLLEKEKRPKSSQKSSDKHPEKPATQSTPGRPEPDFDRMAGDVVDSLLQPLTSKTPEATKKKRKVSFNEATTSESPKAPGKTPTVKRVTKKRKIETEKQADSSTLPAIATPAASNGTTEPAPTPDLAQQTAAVEQQKKQKTKKAKDVQSAESDEPLGKKVPKKTKESKKTATSATKDKVDTGATAGAGEPVKKQRKSVKKDEKAVDSKKSSEPTATDHNGEEVGTSNQASSEANESLLHTSQLALQKSGKTSAETDASKDSATKGRKRKAAAKPLAGADIPPTSKSSSLMSEIVAAICSDLSRDKSNETSDPESSTSKEVQRKAVKKTAPPKSALSAEVTPVSDAPANQETPNVASQTTLGHVGASSSKAPPQTPISTGPLCPICLQRPFHIRYYCPTVLKGPEAIRERLDELKSSHAGSQKSLIKELESLLHRSDRVKSRDLPESRHQVEIAPSASAVSPSMPSTYSPADPAPYSESSLSHDVSLSRTPVMPSNSYMSEVTVEGRDEGSSSESSEDEVEDEESAVAQERHTSDEQRSLAEGDLEAVIRGPAPRRQSILKFLDKVASDKDSADESEDDEGELEEDEEDEMDNRSRRLSRFLADSSDEGEEESRSPSLSLEAVAEVTAGGPAVQEQDESVEKPTEAQGRDIVMTDVVINPSIPGKPIDDSGEETQVEYEESMAVDHDVGNLEKGNNAAVVVATRKSFPVRTTPASQPPDVDIIHASDSGLPAAHDLNEVDADPIEPADDVEVPPDAHLSFNTDPIEVGTPPPENIQSTYSNVTQSTPKPGLSKRMQTREGRVPNDDSELPVLIKDLPSEPRDLVTPIPEKNTRRKNGRVSASQEPDGRRKSARLVTAPLPLTAPTTTAMNGGVNTRPRTSKSVKIPARQSEDALNLSQNSGKNGTTKERVPVAHTPSQVRWETIPELSTPSLSVQMDELMSSSPQPDGDNTILGPVLRKSQKVPPAKKADHPEQEKSLPGEKGRLFDLTSSQIPFPYSQYNDPTSSAPRIEEEESTDSEQEQTATMNSSSRPPPRKSAITYRSLSHLASQAALFSPSLPTPATTSGSNGKAKKPVVDDDDSSSSSSSDSDDAKSDHIPQGRKAGSALPVKRKRGLGSMN